MIWTLKTRPAPATISLECEGELFRGACASLEDAFYTAAKEEVMSDCTGVNNIRVHHCGREYQYAGWKPGMLVEFENEFGAVVWSQRFPELDH